MTETKNKPMSLRKARRWFDENYNELTDAFYEWFTSPTGGLCNATIVGVDSLGHLELRCYYDGYDNDEDAWTWFLDPSDRHFYR